MRTRIKSLSPQVEFALVVGSTFGLLVFLHFVGLYRHGFQPIIRFTNHRMAMLCVYEIIITLLIGRLLYLRSWRRSDFPLNVTAANSGVGLLLWALAWVLFILMSSFMSGPLGLQRELQAISVQGRLSIPIILLIPIINPCFEELLTLGYVIKSLESHGLAFAIGVSTALRLSVHLYQGPLGVASILPIGVLFASYYWKTRQLWPPILAHFLFDFTALVYHAS